MRDMMSLLKADCDLGTTALRAGPKLSDPTDTTHKAGIDGIVSSVHVGLTLIPLSRSIWPAAVYLRKFRPDRSIYGDVQIIEYILRSAYCLLRTQDR